MLDRLGNEYRPKAAAQGLKLRVVKRDVRVSTDPALLERMLRNLIENALRYTTKGGVVIGTRRGGGEVRIDVVDTGVGIAAEKQTEIFGEFVQLHNPGRDLGQGLGLGLSIVARLALLLQTRVDVSSRLHRGSRFSFTLPRTLEAAAADHGPEEGSREARGSVLVMEDNEVLRQSLEAMVSEWGYAAFAAANGEEALELASLGLRVDAILTDYRLGAGLNGIDAATEIRKRAGRAIPTLVLTGDIANQSLAEIRESGFRPLHKPIAADALRQELARMLA